MALKLKAKKMFNTYGRISDVSGLDSSMRSAQEGRYNPSVARTSKQKLSHLLWFEDGRFSYNQAGKGASVEPRHSKNTDACPAPPPAPSKPDPRDELPPATRCTAKVADIVSDYLDVHWQMAICKDEPQPKDRHAQPAEKEKDLSHCHSVSSQCRFLFRLSRMGMLILELLTLHYKVIALVLGCFRVDSITDAKQLHQRVQRLLHAHVPSAPELQLYDFKAVLTLLHRANCLYTVDRKCVDQSELIKLTTSKCSSQKLILQHDDFLRSLMGRKLLDLQQLLWPIEEKHRTAIRVQLDGLVVRAKFAVEGKYV